MFPLKRTKRKRSIMINPPSPTASAIMDWKLFQAAASGGVNFLPQTLESELQQVTPGQKNTLLHIAVSSKQKEFAEKVLGLCPSLLLKANIKGDTALHVAARTGSSKLAQLLINTAKPTPDVESQQSELPLPIVLRKLLRMVNLEKKETALHVAVKSGHFDVAKLLMKEDVGLLDLVDYLDESPLYLAVLGGCYKIVRHILQTYPSSPCGGTSGTNALHAAVYKQHHGLFVCKGIVKILVEKRPEMIKVRDKSERTPLHYAAYSGDHEVIQLLLQRDSSAAYISDKEKMSPLHVAACFGHVKAVRELIQCCPYIWELVDEKGQTALHVSVIAGNEKIVKYLLKVPELVGIINEPDKQGNTPLHLAAVYERHPIICIHARDGRVDKNARNNNSFTAMDIFDSKKPKASFTTMKAYYLLKKSYGPPYLQQIVGGKEKLKQKQVGLENVEGGLDELNRSTCDVKIVGTKLGEGILKQKQVDLENVDGGLDELNKSTYEVYLVVATLITTVTFAAAFTMPGGYKSNEGSKDQGTANSIHKFAFKAFIMFDSIAFSLSIATVYLLFYATPTGYQRSPIYVTAAFEFVHFAIVALALAFVTGMHVMLATSPGFAIAADAMIGFFMLVFFIQWFCDPCMRGVPVPIYGLKKARRYCSEKLFDYGIM